MTEELEVIETVPETQEPVVSVENTDVSSGEEVEEAAPPVEVISVEELLERISTSGAENEAAEEELEKEQEEDMTEEPETLTETDFADYTVTEGLLLCIFLVMFFKILGGAIKEGFYWLW